MTCRLEFKLSVCTGGCSHRRVIYCPEPVCFCDRTASGSPRGVLPLALCHPGYVWLYRAAQLKLWLGILVPRLLSQVPRDCSQDGCTFTQGSFTCKICNFHIQLHELRLFRPVLSPSYPLAAPVSFLVYVVVKSDLVLLRILDLNGGTPPLTYKRFLHILSLLGDPEVPVRNLTAEDFQ